jgi:hypothetical protein
MQLARTARGLENKALNSRRWPNTRSAPLEKKNTKAVFEQGLYDLDAEVDQRRQFPSNRAANGLINCAYSFAAVRS